MRTPFVLLLLLTAAAACSDSSPTATDDATLTFETVVQTSYSGFDDPQKRVIRSVGEWDQVWRTLYASQRPAPPLPAVDFSREVVVLAAAGERSNGCYSIEATRARLIGDGTVEFELTETVPGAACGCTQAVTQPVHLIRMARFQGRELFVDRAFQLAC